MRIGMSKAMGLYVVLGLAAGLTLEGPIRGATLLFLGGLAAKTGIGVLRERQEEREEKEEKEEAATPPRGESE